MMVAIITTAIDTYRLNLIITHTIDLMNTKNFSNHRAAKITGCFSNEPDVLKMINTADGGLGHFTGVAITGDLSAPESLRIIRCNLCLVFDETPQLLSRKLLF